MEAHSLDTPLDMAVVADCYSIWSEHIEDVHLVDSDIRWCFQHNW